VAVIPEQPDHPSGDVLVSLEPHGRGSGNTSSLARAAP
jgi:hypothetical protein